MGDIIKMKNYETVMWLGYSIRSSNWFPMANRENHWILNRTVITMWQALEATQIPGRYFEEICTWKKTLWGGNRGGDYLLPGTMQCTWDGQSTREPFPGPKVPKWAWCAKKLGDLRPSDVQEGSPSFVCWLYFTPWILAGCIPLINHLLFT